MPATIPLLVRPGVTRGLIPATTLTARYTNRYIQQRFGTRAGGLVGPSQPQQNHFDAESLVIFPAVPCQTDDYLADIF